MAVILHAALLIAVPPSSGDGLQDTIDLRAIPDLATRCFDLTVRDRLRPAPEGPICLTIPVAYPSTSNRDAGWLEHGAGGKSHPILGTAFRYARYKAVLGELLVQGDSPAVAGLVASLDALLEGVSADTEVSELADSLAARAPRFAPGAADVIVDAAGALVRMIGGGPVGDGAINGSLRAMILEALAHGRTLARAAALDAPARTSSLGRDPAFDRARGRIVLDLKRRHQVREQVLGRLVTYHRENPDPGVVTRAPVPALPRALARAAFPAIPGDALDEVIYDDAARVGRPLTVESFMEGDARLILVATLDHGLFGGGRLDLDGPDSAVGSEGQAVHELRLYLVRIFHRSLLDLLDGADDRFLTDDLGWRIDTEIVGWPMPATREDIMRRSRDAISRIDAALEQCDPARP